MINIVCTSKPGDGLLCYSYEHCCYLNSIGIEAKVVIITHHNFTIQDYVNSINEKYKTYENVAFNSYTPSTKDITLIMGRSQLTLPYKDRRDYTHEQLFHVNKTWTKKQKICVRITTKSMMKLLIALTKCNLSTFFRKEFYLKTKNINS